MNKIKLLVVILYVVFAVEILGAWNYSPQVEETAAFSADAVNEMALDENTEARLEQEAQIRMAGIHLAQQAQSNIYHAEYNAAQEQENEQQRKEQLRRRRRLREKKKEETEILERIVEAEAGDQNLKGRILVANVILNRVKSRHFPDSIEGVVFANRGGRYQFSPIYNGSYYRVTVSDKTKKAVKMALNGTDYSEGALYFMCRSASDPLNVTWFDRDLTKVKEYGCHEFFR